VLGRCAFCGHCAEEKLETRILTGKACGVGFDNQRRLFRDICCKSPLGAKIGYKLIRYGVFSEIPFWRFLGNRQTMFDFVLSVPCQRAPHRPPIYAPITPTSKVALHRPPPPGPPRSLPPRSSSTTDLSLRISHAPSFDPPKARFFWPPPWWWQEERICHPFNRPLHKNRFTLLMTNITF
jgi:hypothetical protein